MNMKKSLLSLTAIVGLLSASVGFAVMPNNRSGYIDANTSATVDCSASRFFPGAPPGTTVENEQAGGLQTDFLITNISENKTLMITQVNVYAMTTGAVIASYTPPSPPPPSSDPSDPVFKWKLKPHETTRLFKEAVLPPQEVANPNLLWNSVSFTVKAGNDTKILAPMVYADYAEYKTPALGGAIIDRIRANCVYR
ncbi:MAG: hypothetical protein QX203_05970 [Methylococcaceae bacterium]